MNSIITLFDSHRSIRRFTEQAIEASLLQELLRAGQHASSSSFIQSTSVIRITKENLRAQFVDLSGGQKYIASAAEFLVFCADLQRNKVRGEQANQHSTTTKQEALDFGWTEQFLAATVDVALFAQNVAIAAESAGLGVCYIGGIRNNPSQVVELLDLPDLVYPVFGMCLGYPDQDPSTKPRMPLELQFHQDKYVAPEGLAKQFDEYDQQIRAYYQQRSGGKLDHSWSEQLNTQAKQQSRPFMLDFLQEKGFLIK